MDSRGQPELAFNLFTKVLFRVAHYWATNIDIEEYIDLLNKIYDRIISYKYFTGYTGEVLPVIDITFPTMEKRVLDTGGRPDKSSSQMDDWLECRSEESNRSDYDYKYEEDPDNMVVKKYKKQRALGGGAGQGGDSSANANISATLKDPIIYHEEVRFDLTNIKEGCYLYAELLEMDDILPFGYPTQFALTNLKNEVF